MQSYKAPTVIELGSVQEFTRGDGADNGFDSVSYTAFINGVFVDGTFSWGTS